jgi:hypothetical protein
VLDTSQAYEFATPGDIIQDIDRQTYTPPALEKKSEFTGILDISVSADKSAVVLTHCDGSQTSIETKYEF